MFLNCTGVFNGPDIRKLMRDTEFDIKLSQKELTAWTCVKEVINNVLGGKRSPLCRTYVSEMMDAFEKIGEHGVHMSTKIHFLHFHMDCFERQLATESDEHGERFHQTCLPIEERYKGKSIHALIADLCWTLVDEGIKLPRARRKKNE